MRKSTRILTLTTAAIIACTTSLSTAQACELCKDSEQHHLHIHSTANNHAPIGVMGDHMHKKGEWMVSYRFQMMNMEGNRDGTNDLTPEEVIAYPNSNPGLANLRVVPTQMRMDMHMFGGMYAPTDWLTLMAMGMYVEKEMSHITYNMMGTAELGRFTTNSSGWGDSSVAGLFRLYEDGTHHIHLNAGLSIPTGSIKEEDQVLAPNGMTPVFRLPYGMQLGTGTYDALPGITYTGEQDVWSWGAQYSARIPLESENNAGYVWGDKHSITAWGSYEWADWISTSLRLTGTTQNEIDGADSRITAPVQTADPDNYGGQTLELGLGVNLFAPKGPLADHRLAIEASAPLHRDLNGPQMKQDWNVTIGWQYAF